MAGLPPPGCDRDADLASYEPNRASRAVSICGVENGFDLRGRLQTRPPIRRAGDAAVPFTTGILIGIGETRLDRIEALLALRELQDRYGHIQEIIIQNFRAKPGTRMAAAPGVFKRNTGEMDESSLATV